MAQEYGVKVTGTGGFSSLTVTHAFASRVARRAQPTVLLHVGDFDPSGVSIFESMCQDIGAFVAGKLYDGRHDPDTGQAYNDVGEAVLIPRRVALTEPQVAMYDLPTAPPKSSDTRSINWHGSTTQAEALPPDLLGQIVQEAIQEWWDDDADAERAQREYAERDIIGEQLTAAVEALRDPIRDAIDEL